jgi:putative tricarboxylic transport membrane protein
MLRADDKPTLVEALFDITAYPHLPELFNTLGITVEDATLLLKRVLTKSGSRCYINAQLATVAMLLPITFNLPPVGALIMLAGIYYGAQYGGSTTAILVNMPGEVTAVVTALDGHEMAKQGRAGAALGIAALGSFFAGTVATLIIAAIGAPLTRLALLFGPAEYFGLMVFGLGLAIVLARGSVLKAVIMVLLGLLLSTVGTDLETGQERLTLGIPELSDGVDFAVLAMGLFGIAEILRNLENPESRNVAIAQIGRLLPTRAELKRCFGPIVRATGVGSILGILPGNGAVLGPFASYAMEKKLAKDPSRFGQGAIEGVAGPEAANNAGAQTSFIPLLTLGIPPNAVMALMVGAMTIHGLIPGPQVITKYPNLFWGMIASMWIGNLLLLIINLPLIGLWVRLLKVPYRLMFTTILLFCAIGIYSINNNPYDVYFTAFFGLVGYVFIKLGLEPAPMLLGFVLGRLMEEKMRQALALSEGSFMTFVERPVAAVLLALAVGIILIAVLPAVSRSRQKAFQE